MSKNKNSHFHFDDPVPRRGSGSLKWDMAKDPSVIPLWVADMDFEVAPAITMAIAKRAMHPIFGYTHVNPGYYRATAEWFAERHNWQINPSHILHTTGIVPALSAIVGTLCLPGEGVIIQTPAYNAFFPVIEENGCRVRRNPLKRIDTPQGFTFEIDFDQLEQLASEPDTRMLILCNPHNPTGRVWTKEELARISAICRANGVLIVSDEIHCEFAMPGFSYTPMANIDSDSIVCCSPSKAFNIAGLETSNVIVTDPELRGILEQGFQKRHISDLNPFGAVALEAAYTQGGDWLDALMEYLDENRKHLRNYIAEHMPMLKVADSESTYLAWVDISALNISSQTLQNRALAGEKVWINNGDMYGDDRFIRINFACPRQWLTEGLKRLADTINGL